MAIKLFVGSLSWGVNDDQLADHFAQAGTVVSAKVITDRETNRSKGFGFVEMSSDEEAKIAIDKLNNTELDGRAITVNEARPREERPKSSYSGGGGGGYGNNRGGGGGGYNDRRY
jgi:RNA recognition motif-containing protein